MGGGWSESAWFLPLKWGEAEGVDEFDDLADVGFCELRVGSDGFAFDGHFLVYQRGVDDDLRRVRGTGLCLGFSTEGETVHPWHFDVGEDEVVGAFRVEVVFFDAFGKEVVGVLAVLEGVDLEVAGSG